MKKSYVLTQMIEKMDNDTESPIIKTKIIPNLKRLSLLLSSFESTINTQFPNDTPNQHVERIIKNGSGLQQKINRISNENINIIGTEYRRLHSDALQKAGINPTKSRDEAEIRSIMRKMSIKEQYALLEKKDPEIISALIDVNPILHNVPLQPLEATILDMKKDVAPKNMVEADELMDFLPLEKTISEQAGIVITSAMESDHVKEVLEASQQAVGVHSDFIQQLKGV